MSYSIIVLGGKQYQVAKGDNLIIDKVPHDEGTTFTVSEVLLTNNDSKVEIGTPFVEGAKVELKVIRQLKGKKLVVTKFKSKSRYRKTQGHRQHLSKLEVIKLG